MVRGLLSDEEWAFFEPFVIECGALRGRPPRDHPEELGNWNSVHRQYRRWTASGLWDLMLEGFAEGGGNNAVQMVGIGVAPFSWTVCGLVGYGSVRATSLSAS